MEEIFKIANALLVPCILGLVKMFSDLRVAQNSHKNLQAEVNEHKRDVKEDLRSLQKEYKLEINELKQEINQRFDKVETLIEKVFLYERDTK